MLSLRIALRYLFSRKSHSAVNIISAVSFAGIAVATVATVCVLSVFNGFSAVAYSRLSHVDPDLQITPASGTGVMAAADSVAAVATATEGVAAALPTLTAQALAVMGEERVPVRIKGVAPGYENLTGLADLVVDGVLMGADERVEEVGGVYSYASLSVGVAVRLPRTGSGVYDFLRLYVPRRHGRINPAAPLATFACDSLIPGAVFQVDQPEWDADLVIMPLDRARRLLEYTGGEASAIEIRTAAGADVESVKKALERSLGDGYVVKNRLEQQAHTFRMINVEKWVTFLMLAFILVIASFNVVTTLSILVIDKTQNIRTLSALGASARMITRIFMLQGWMISFLGGALGVVLGVALCLGQQHFGWLKLAGESSLLTIDSYPVEVRAADITVVIALVVVTGLLSTLVTRRFVRSRTASVP